MENTNEEKDKATLTEKLAEYSHDIAWAGWMIYMFTQGTFNDDGTWTMPAEKAERWTRQMETKYDSLTEKERESDREQARFIIEIIGNH